MLAARRADVTDLNDRARALMAAAGRLTGPTLRAHGQDGERSFAVGDVVIARRNDYRAGLFNGQRGVLRGADRLRDRRSGVERRSNIRARGLVALPDSSDSGLFVVTAIVSKTFDRSGAYAEQVRNGYADATKALNAWGHFPFRIRRRIDDDPETLRGLEVLGAQIQESLAFSAGWVSGESAVIGEIYNELVTLLRGEVAIHAREAWTSPPRKAPGDMNLAGPPMANPQQDDGNWGLIPGEWIVVRLFSQTIRYRFGWRRYLVPATYLRWKLRRMRVIETANESLKTRSGRILTGLPAKRA